MNTILFSDSLNSMIFEDHSNESQRTFTRIRNDNPHTPFTPGPVVPLLAPSPFLSSVEFDRGPQTKPLVLVTEGKQRTINAVTGRET